MEEGGKGGWRIILGKARKLALASFNIRFILFPATMLGDSLFSRAPSFHSSLPPFFTLLSRVSDVDRCKECTDREEIGPVSNFLRDCYYQMEI